MLCLFGAAMVGVPTYGTQASASNGNSVTFNVERGYVTGPVTVELSGAADIVYSTAWGDEWLADDFLRVARRYSGPLTLSGTTQLRAMAIGDEHAVSHTYIDISGYSTSDQAVLQSMPYLVTAGPSFGGRFGDAKTIVELAHPDGSSISAPAGIRLRDSAAQLGWAPEVVEVAGVVEFSPGVSAPDADVRNRPAVNPVAADLPVADRAAPLPSSPSPSSVAASSAAPSSAMAVPAPDFRLYFRGDYGASRLSFDMFASDLTGASTGTRYDKLDFHTGGRDALGLTWQATGCTPSRGTMLRDRFFKSLQRVATGDGVPGGFFFVWHRDTFVGLMNAEDVPHQGFMSEHFGASKPEYGLWTHYRHELPEGNPYSSGEIDLFMGSVDLANYVDQLLIQWLSAHVDLAHHNGASSVVVSGLFNGPYYHWLWGMDATATAGCSGTSATALDPIADLLVDADFAMLLADRIHLHFDDGGAMSAQALRAQWTEMADQVSAAIPLVFDGDWARAERSMRYRIDRASDHLLSWLGSEGLQAKVPAVSYSEPAGPIEPDTQVTLTGGEEIWFALDGTDPRAPGGDVSESAERYTGSLSLPSGTVQMLARVRVGDAWGPARPMVFHSGEPRLVISEATVEYVEITNRGSLPINLERWRLAGDVRFRFDYGRAPILRPGGSVVLAKDEDVFVSRWGRQPDGEFLGAVGATDPLRLLDSELVVQHEVMPPLLVDGVPGTGEREQHRANRLRVVLNEWNAVSNSRLVEGGDARLGSVPGNGGDWFELVVLEEIDLRDWSFVISDANSYASVAFTDDLAWKSVPSGAIITVSEHPLVAEDGTVYGTDTSIDPESGDWWLHVVSDESNAFVDRVRFPASANNWTMEIFDAEGVVHWGPVGEGVGALRSGVSKTEIGELEADPTPGLQPDTAPYDDGDASTLGLPNQFGGSTQDFSSLRREVLATTARCMVRIAAAAEVQAGSGGGSAGGSDLCDE